MGLFTGFSIIRSTLQSRFSLEQRGAKKRRKPETVIKQIESILSHMLYLFVFDFSILFMIDDTLHWQIIELSVCLRSVCSL